MKTVSLVEKWLKGQEKNREWLAGQLDCSLSTLNRHLGRPKDVTFFLAVSKVTGLSMAELVPNQRAAPKVPVAV